MSVTTPAGQLGFRAPPFDLPAVDGRDYTLESVRGSNGVLVMFICNHCPYVKAVIDKIVRDARDLAAHDIGSIAIMSNDPTEYPEDSFDNMKAVAAQHGFTFPYVIDETQDIGRAYGAACTPDFFGFNSRLELAYRGRLDASGRSPDPNAARELYDAMLVVARTGKGPAEQKASIGCSIKWRRES
jgi:peroxiredoxin